MWDVSAVFPALKRTIKCLKGVGELIWREPAVEAAVKTWIRYVRASL